MKLLNKEFLMKFISCFGPTSSKRGSSSSMNAVAHPTHLSTIEEENHDCSISCAAEGDLYCPAVNYDTKRVSGKKKKLNRSNTISSTSSDHHQHQQHYWCPSLSVISEDKTTIATSVHRISSSSPPPPSSGMMKKLLAGNKHGSSRRQRSTDSNEYHPHNHHFEPMMPAFSPVAFMF